MQSEWMCDSAHYWAFMQSGWMCDSAPCWMFMQSTFLVLNTTYPAWSFLPPSSPDLSDYRLIFTWSLSASSFSVQSSWTSTVYRLLGWPFSLPSVKRFPPCLLMADEGSSVTALTQPVGSSGFDPQHQINQTRCHPCLLGGGSRRIGDPRSSATYWRPT